MAKRKIPYVSTTDQNATCPVCTKEGRGSSLSVKQLEGQNYLVCSYNSICSFKQKVEAENPIPKPQPITNIEFSDPYDLYPNNQSNKLICQPLQRGDPNGLRARLAKLNKRKGDSDIWLGSSGYVVSESSAVLSNDGWVRE
jgi:hypothetical protein